MLAKMQILYEATGVTRNDEINALTAPWRSFEAVEFATLEWVDWFSHRRLLEPIGNIRPAEAEQRFYGMMDTEELAA